MHFTEIFRVADLFSARVGISGESALHGSVSLFAIHLNAILKISHKRRGTRTIRTAIDRKIIPSGPID
jgi:hypothetical protein